MRVCKLRVGVTHICTTRQISERTRRTRRHMHTSYPRTVHRVCVHLCFNHKTQIKVDKLQPVSHTSISRERATNDFHASSAVVRAPAKTASAAAEQRASETAGDLRKHICAATPFDRRQFQHRRRRGVSSVILDNTRLSVRQHRQRRQQRRGRVCAHAVCVCYLVLVLCVSTNNMCAMCVCACLRAHMSTEYAEG